MQKVTLSMLQDAEGNSSHATGFASHAEGIITYATGYVSHAEGRCTCACGKYSHSEGCFTIAQNTASHAEGMYNIGTATDTIHETGIGTSSGAKKNAFEIYTDGRLVAPELSPALINTLRSLITKEYLLSAEFGNSLPLSDPLVAGALWNNGGIVTVSMG